MRLSKCTASRIRLAAHNSTSANGSGAGFALGPEPLNAKSIGTPTASPLTQYRRSRRRLMDNADVVGQFATLVVAFFPTPFSGAHETTNCHLGQTLGPKTDGIADALQQLHD